MEYAQYTIHTDAESGWLAVPMAELMSLGIGKHITSFAHRNGEVAYLEESEDLSAFYNAKGWTNWNERQTLIRRVQDCWVSPIRKYDQFSLDLPADEQERKAFEHLKWGEWADKVMEQYYLPKMPVEFDLPRITELLDEAFPTRGAVCVALEDSNLVTDFGFWKSDPDYRKRKAMANLVQKILKEPENRHKYQLGVWEDEQEGSIMLGRPRRELLEETVDRFCDLLPAEMVRAAFAE